MKQMPQVLTEEEIINKLQKGVGRKRFKTLFSKLLKLNGLKPLKHFLSPRWEESEEYSMHWREVVQRAYGFEHMITNDTEETYSSIDGASPAVAEKCFIVAQDYCRC